MKIQTIKINEINLKDERFRVTYFFSLEKLIHSIGKVGLLYPLIGVYRKNKIILVSGWKRVQACNELSITSVPVRIIDEKDDLKVFLISLHDNLSTREFSPAEKAEAVRKLKGFGVDEKIIMKSYLPQLDITPTLRHLDIFLLLSEMEDSSKKFIHEKSIPYQALKYLIEYSSDERAMLLPVLHPLGNNKRRELLEDLYGLSKKEDKSPIEVLQSQSVRNILDSKSLSLRQKAERICLFIKRKKNQQFYAKKEAFQSILRKINKPEDISFLHSPTFEDKDVSIELSFKSVEELQEKASNLLSLAKRKEISELFQFDSDE